MGSPFGEIKLPGAITAKYGTVDTGAVGKFLNLILNVLVVGASIYAIVNLVTAGYGFMAAGDDSKKVAASWAKIWQTLLGLAIASGAFVLAAIFGQLIYGDPSAILSPQLPKP